MQRIAIVLLQSEPAEITTVDLIAQVDDGIYIVGDKSLSIDKQRYNFQSTVQWLFRIRDGLLDGQLRAVAYQAITDSGIPWQPCADRRPGCGIQVLPRPSPARWSP